MMGARASRCAWVVFGSKETVTQVAFFSVPPLVAEVARQPIFCAREIHVTGMSLADSHGHIELTKWMFGMLMPVTIAEVTLAKQMATAGFRVVGFHPPRRFPWCRGQRDRQSQDQPNQW